MTDSNESLHPRGITIAPRTVVNPAKLFFQYQASMLRMWATNCELAAHLLDRRLETPGSEPEQHREAA